MSQLALQGSDCPEHDAKGPSDRALETRQCHVSLRFGGCDCAHPDNCTERLLHGCRSLRSGFADVQARLFPDLRAAPLPDLPSNA